MTKLAINGGTPAVTDWIPATWPIYDDREKKALIDVLESGKWCCTWSLEGKVGQFGREFVFLTIAIQVICETLKGRG